MAYHNQKLLLLGMRRGLASAYTDGAAIAPANTRGVQYIADDYFNIFWSPSDTAGQESRPLQ